MRVSLRRAVQWVCVIALVQIVAVYYWSIKRSRRPRVNLTPHRYIESIKGQDGTCSFQTCPGVKDGMLNVHLIPHSHIDVGWLKTVDQYYTGQDPLDEEPNPGCVQCTLNSTIKELQKDPSRRFVFIEMKYLARYWSEIDAKQRAVIRQLIKERRLELLNGGWVMSDAGVTMYNDIIDQQTLGFDFIRDTFGPCAQTRTAWHVDQFGHSREHASIFAQMGYDSLFVGRIDFQDLANRKRTQNLEFVWDTSPNNFKEKTKLFTQATFDGYYAPPQYIYDRGGSNSAKSDRELFNFIKIVQERARSFKTNHLLVPMGCDFGYVNAQHWFANMDPLIQKINEMQSGQQGKPINLIYSTPSCYTYHVNKEKIVFETKSDDFHPYGISPGAYWTGYFTTRGGLKKHIKYAAQILQSCKHLSIFSGLDDTFNKINHLRDAVAVMQHHDAITGTQKKHVMKDYNRILSESIKHCEEVMSQAYQRIWGTEDTIYVPHQLPSSQFCHSLNISSCEISEGSKSFIVTLYNPLSWPVDTPVRLPVNLRHLHITNGDGSEIPFQIVPVPDQVKVIPERPFTSPSTEAVFMAQLPPMSVSSFRIAMEEGGPKPHFDHLSGTELVIENEHLLLKFDTSMGTLISVHNKDRKIQMNVAQDFYYYVGRQSERPSGAYVFIPDGTPPKRVGLNGKVEISVVRGSLVQEVHQKFCSWVSQVVRLYKGAKHAEFQWVVGPIGDELGHRGKEIISLFTSPINSGDSFYTDSNGREMLQRRRDMRESWDYQVKDHISGNYYPVTSRIFIKDQKKDVQLTLMPDRPQGGSSLASGSLELMVHRKLLMDDGLGVNEPLNDVGVNGKGIVFTGKHYLCLDTIKESVILTKQLAMQLHLAPVPMFTPLLEGQDWESAQKQHTFLSAALPDNVQILTLDRVTKNDTTLYLLRLEHILEEEEHPTLSQPVEVFLEYLFKPFDIVSAEETTLGGNFIPSEISRLQWKTSEGPTESSIASPDYMEHMVPPFKVTLRPMEIRTFRVQVVRDS